MAEILCAFLTAALAALQQSANRQIPPPASDTPSPLVAAAIRLVHTHLGDSSLSVHGIATSLGCSPDHLSRRFRKDIGHSLQTFILEERIALACDLLQDARFNIAEVGWACGFNEPAHFIRTFGRLRGTTPLRFRNSHRS
jgi:transcriptional regulator GlxA family with amidase domain